MERTMADRPSLFSRASYRFSRMVTPLVSNLNDVDWSENSSRTSLSSVSSTSTAATSITDEHEYETVEDVFVAKNDTLTPYTFTTAHKVFHRDLHHNLNEVLPGHVYLSRLRLVGKDLYSFRPSILIITTSAKTKLAFAQYLRKGPPILRRLSTSGLDIHLVLDSFGLAGCPDDVYSPSSYPGSNSSQKSNSCYMTVRDDLSNKSTTFVAGMKLILGDEPVLVSVYHPLAMFDPKQKKWQEASSNSGGRPDLEDYCGAMSIYFDDVYDEDLSVKVCSAYTKIPDLSQPRNVLDFMHDYGLCSIEQDDVSVLTSPVANKTSLIQHNAAVSTMSTVRGSLSLVKSEVAEVADQDQSGRPTHMNYCPLEAELLASSEDTDWSVWKVQTRGEEQRLSLQQPNEIGGYVIDQFLSEDVQNQLDVTVQLPDQTLSARLHPDTVFYQIGSQQLELKVISLDKPLKRGQSGAVVTHKNKAVGMLVAVQDHRSEAYIMTFDTIIKDIENVTGTTVRLPLPAKPSFQANPLTNLSSTNEPRSTTTLEPFDGRRPLPKDTYFVHANNSENLVRTFPINGIGGVGKTQVASEYIRTQKELHDAKSMKKDVWASRSITNYKGDSSFWLSPPTGTRNHLLRNPKKFVCHHACCPRKADGFYTQNELKRHEASVHDIRRCDIRCLPKLDILTRVGSQFDSIELNSKWTRVDTVSCIPNPEETTKLQNSAITIERHFEGTYREGSPPLERRPGAHHPTSLDDSSLWNAESAPIICCLVLCSILQGWNESSLRCAGTAPTIACIAVIYALLPWLVYSCWNDCIYALSPNWLSFPRFVVSVILSDGLDCFTLLSCFGNPVFFMNTLFSHSEHLHKCFKILRPRCLMDVLTSEEMALILYSDRVSSQMVIATSRHHPILFGLSRPVSNTMDSAIKGLWIHHARHDYRRHNHMHRVLYPTAKPTGDSLHPSAIVVLSTDVERRFSEAVSQICSLVENQLRARKNSEGSDVPRLLIRGGFGSKMYVNMSRQTESALYRAACRSDHEIVRLISESMVDLNRNDLSASRSSPSSALYHLRPPSNCESSICTCPSIDEVQNHTRVWPRYDAANERLEESTQVARRRGPTLRSKWKGFKSAFRNRLAATIPMRRRSIGVKLGRQRNGGID